MADPDALIPELRDARARFLALVEAIRPELHRYCARMTGSVIDGEDIVQDTLARAYFALGELATVPPLRPWLFRIAHHRAIDHLRHRDRRASAPLDDARTPEVADAGPEDGAIRSEGVHAALSAFVELPATQRSCVILKDVLGHSQREIAELLGLSIPAVESCLHRGRARLRAHTPASSSPPALHSKVARQYAQLFDARDWDGVRALLSEHVQLELVAHLHKSGRRSVGEYFGNYGSLADWRVALAWLEGREVLAFYDHADDAVPAYFVELVVDGDALVGIRDYRYVPYIAVDAEPVLG